MRNIFITLVFIILLAPNALVAATGEKIDLIPSAPYDRFIIYESLVLFWVGIIGLIIIIRMRLREVERTQRMGLNKEEENAPLLD